MPDRPAELLQAASGMGGPCVVCGRGAQALVPAVKTNRRLSGERKRSLSVQDGGAKPPLAGMIGSREFSATERETKATFPVDFARKGSTVPLGSEREREHSRA